VLQPVEHRHDAAGGHVPDAEGLLPARSRPELQYLGEQIERYNASQVTGALVAPNTNQIRFVSSDAPGLVFDYLAGEWATFTNFEAVGCAVWRGAASS
jgi:hypothetical protein